MRSHQPEPEPGGPALVVEHLTKQFGDRLAVDNVSFSVEAGEVFGFLGPNGAGKTTTVRMLGTLIAPSVGHRPTSPVCRSCPPTASRSAQRIAVMPENPGLYLRLTRRREPRVLRRAVRLAQQPETRIEQCARGGQPRGRARTTPAAASQRACASGSALARALLSDPAVLFLDEPTSGLDPVATRDVHELIDGLRDRGVTVFLTTHRLEEAERLCDRVAILNTSLRTIGRPDELRDRLFTKTLLVTTAAPLARRRTRLRRRRRASTAGERDNSSRYELTVTRRDASPRPRSRARSSPPAPTSSR